MSSSSLSNLSRKFAKGETARTVFMARMNDSDFVYTLLVRKGYLPVGEDNLRKFFAERVTNVLASNSSDMMPRFDFDTDVLDIDSIKVSVGKYSLSTNQRGDIVAIITGTYTL